MSTTYGNVIVELFDLVLTERKDDRFGRVVTSNHLLLMTWLILLYRGVRT